MIHAYGLGVLALEGGEAPGQPLRDMAGQIARSNAAADTAENYEQSSGQRAHIKAAKPV